MFKGIHSLPKVVCITCALLAFLTCKQPVEAQNASRQQVDSLLKVVQEKKTDTGKFNSLLKLARFQVWKPGELKADLDSAISYHEQAANMLHQMSLPEQTGFFYLVDSYILNEQKQRKLSDDMLEKAIGFFLKGKDKTLLGEGYLEKIYRFDNNITNINRRIDLGQRAAAAFGQAGNKKRQAECLTLLADLRTMYGNDERALPELDSAKKIYASIHATNLQIYIVYSRFYSQRDNYREALRSILVALELAEIAKDDSRQVGELNNHASILFYKLSENNNAVLYAKKALDIAEKHREVSDMYDILHNITNAYLQLGESGNALRTIKQIEQRYGLPKAAATLSLDKIINLSIYNSIALYTKGQIYYDQLSELLSRPGLDNNKLKNMAYHQMISFCIGSKQYKKALTHLISNDNIVQKSGSPSLIETNYSLWFTLDTIQKDYFSATRHLLKLKTIHDSIFNEAESRQLREMQIQYETRKKENDIKLQQQRILTLTQEQKLQQARLEKADLIRNITFGGIICVLIFAGLLYRQSRERKAGNQVIARKNEQLEHLLTENELLLKEIHHRVKNNMQMITSLLHSQSAYLKDEAALDAILKSQHRVQSMALIHQKLYKATNYSSVYLPEYVQDLMEYIKGSFDCDLSIYFKLEVEPLFLDIANAIPLGLIINESITNAIKHAFSSPGNNIIQILLRRLDNEVQLVVEDNGDGLPHDFDHHQNSFGLVLMKGLTAQMNGKFEIRNGDGTVVTISFTPLPAVGRNLLDAKEA